ncbi:MAG: hypothetical protein V1827_01430 [Candidatus Micrarchaeota archaeon]
MAEAFEGMIEEAKRLERKLTEYAPFQGAVVMERGLDLEPKDYVDLNYADLLNMYERTQKIISASGLGVFAESGREERAPEQVQAPKAAAATAEVESRLKEMTTETLKTAEEVAKETIVIEREEPRPEDISLEIERPSPPKTEGERKPPELEIEKERPEAAPEPRKPDEAPKAELPPSAKAPPMPPALRESPDQAGERRYGQMEEQIRAAVGEKADEMTLKKKMLDLTKQLFKEKATSKREEIKIQITVIKNMLAAGAQAPKGRAAAKAAAPEGDAHIKLLDTLVSTHQGELSATKDTIIESYNKQITEIKNKFYDDLSATDDPAKRKQRFEAFVFAVESLVEHLPETMAKYREFTSKKHAAELEKLKASLGAKEKETLTKVEERLGYVQNGYEQEFTAVKGIVGRQIENLIEVAGNEIFKKPEEKPVEAEEKALEMVKEINESDEGTLLYFLHSKDPDCYKRYERKQLSKAEVLFKAKELMAKEKGLSEANVKKYFSKMEG